MAKHQNPVIYFIFSGLLVFFKELSIQLPSVFKRIVDTVLFGAIGLRFLAIC